MSSHPSVDNCSRVDFAALRGVFGGGGSTAAAKARPFRVADRTSLSSLDDFGSAKSQPQQRQPQQFHHRYPRSSSDTAAFATPPATVVDQAVVAPRLSDDSAALREVFSAASTHEVFTPPGARQIDARLAAGPPALEEQEAEFLSAQPTRDNESPVDPEVYDAVEADSDGHSIGDSEEEPAQIDEDAKLKEVERLRVVCTSLVKQVCRSGREAGLPGVPSEEELAALGRAAGPEDDDSEDDNEDYSDANLWDEVQALQALFQNMHNVELRNGDAREGSSRQEECLALI